MDRLSTVVEADGTPLLLRIRHILGSVSAVSVPTGHIYPEIGDHPGAVPPRAGNGASTSRDGQLALMNPDDVDADKMPQQQKRRAT